MADGAEARGPLAFANGELLAADDRGWVLGARAGLLLLYPAPGAIPASSKGPGVQAESGYFGSQFGSQPSAVRIISTVQTT
jgi:hypothetical protein